MNNKKTAAIVCKNSRSFVILWSDHTWEMFITGYEWERADHMKCHYEVKDGFEPYETARCRMTREEFIKYYRENVKIVEEES